MVSLNKEPSSQVASDLPRHLALATEVTESANKLVDMINNTKVDLEADQGLSFLDLKNRVMLDYLCDLTYVLLKKCHGKSISGEAAIERIVTNRTVMEKMRPIEQKLRYQIDKAVKVAESGEIRPDDPLHFKANPAALVGKIPEEGEEDEEDSEGDDDDEKETGGKYVIPKHIPAYYNDEKTPDEREEEERKKAKRKQLSKTMIEDLKRQHLDTPEEVFDQEDVMKKRQVEAYRERIRFEEDNFTRLPLTKKQKARRERGRMSTMGTIADEVTSFGGRFGSAAEGGKKRKRKSSSKGSGKKRRFKK